MLSLSLQIFHPHPHTHICFIFFWLSNVDKHMTPSRKKWSTEWMSGRMHWNRNIYYFVVLLLCVVALDSFFFALVFVFFLFVDIRNKGYLLTTRFLFILLCSHNRIKGRNQRNESAIITGKNKHFTVCRWEWKSTEDPIFHTMYFKKPWS